MGGSCEILSFGGTNGRQVSVIVTIVLSVANARMRFIDIQILINGTTSVTGIPPKAMNHVGITVTNLEEAGFYTKVFGFTVLKKEMIDTQSSSSIAAKIFNDIFKGLLK